MSVPVPILIAAKDLRQRVRDRSAVVIAVVAPLVIAALMALAFNGASNFHYTLGVVNDDHGPVAAGLIDALHARDLSKVLAVKALPSTAAAAAALRANGVQAALVIPDGFSAAIGGAHPLGLGTLTSVNSQVAGQVTASIASSFVAQLNADRLSVATAIGAGAAKSSSAHLEAAAARLAIPEQVVQRPIGSQPLKPISYFSPAMAIFFLFFTVSYTARSFFSERDQGLIERMRAAPIRPVEIVAGKALSVLVFGLASISVVAVVTSVAFGARWGSPVAAGLVCLAMVLTIVALSALVMGLARTQRQAEGISSAIVFGLALLGGNFVSVASEPSVMRKIALFTPNGWALRAFTDLSTLGGGLATVMVPVVAILAFGAAVGAVAMVLAPRAVGA